MWHPSFIALHFLILFDRMYRIYRINLSHLVYPVKDSYAESGPRVRGSVSKQGDRICVIFLHPLFFSA